jgi:hypothetical protein
METTDIPATQVSLHIDITNDTMLIMFFCIKGTVHFPFIPQGQSVNQTHYVEILKRLHEAVRRRPELWRSDWILHHDNAAAHKALSVK